jgi:hypothetical protein
MADRVDAPVHAVQAPREDPALDLPLRQTRATQLGERGDAVLPRSDFGDAAVGFVTNPTPTVGFVTKSGGPRRHALTVAAAA